MSSREEKLRQSVLNDTPENFLAGIPTTMKANLKYRKALHPMLAEDLTLRQRFIQLCLADPIIAFRTMYWTFNPKNKTGMRNMPFIPWTVQEDGIREIVRCVRTGEDLLIDKSRDMGATWIILGAFFFIWQFEEDSHLLVASRKEEYVDKRGDHKCLFSKLLYLYNHLPAWAQPEHTKTHMHLENKDNRSVIDGESTNPDLGAGDRRKSVMLDEFARVDAGDAESISDTLSDTTDCVIYNSTHTNRGHPYAKLRYSKRVKVFVLPWWKRPDRCEGLYRSPDLGKIEIFDIQYYRKHWPEIFWNIDANTIFDTSDIEISAAFHGAKHNLFIADGSGKWRSEWYDGQCRRRSARDIAQNLDMDPVGSGDMLFDGTVLQRCRIEIVRDPDLEGEIRFGIKVAGEYDSEWDRDEIKFAKFKQNDGRKRLKWWGELINNRPNQDHVFVIGCDVSLGTGVSNSVMTIFDVTLRQKVGSWVCSLTSPTNFAEQVVAMAQWVGGKTEGRPYLIWESNGPGLTFGRRIHSLGYRFYYMQRDEVKVYRKRSKNPGWASTSSNKMDLLIAYREALDLGFRLDDQEKRYINPDADSISEAEDYVFLSGSSVGPANSQSEESGATATHGDRVIADALTYLGAQDVYRRWSQEEEHSNHTAAGRRREYNRTRRESEDARWQD